MANMQHACAPMVPSASELPAADKIHLVVHHDLDSNPEETAWMVSSISLSDEKEAFLTRCECELSFGHSGAAVMAVGCSASNVYSASCAGILVGGSHGRPDMWLLGVQTILQVLNTVRFLPNMSLAQPDEDMVRKAEQEYGFFCMEIPEKEQLSLQPYSETSKHMTPAIVELTAVMIGEFDADRVIKRRNKESIRKIGSRSSVKAAIQAYSNQPKVQDKIEDTTRFDYGESQGELTFIVLQVGGLQPAGQATGTKGATKRQLNVRDDVWTCCIVPFDSDTAVSTDEAGDLEELPIMQHVQKEMLKNRWFPDMELQPRSPMFHDYRALAARLKSDNTTGQDCSKKQADRAKKQELKQQKADQKQAEQRQRLDDWEYWEKENQVTAKNGEAEHSGLQKEQEEAK
ncbi:TPA: hypothetical protein ACH3X2_008516 [Trebouxia sp. C0005]